MDIAVKRPDQAIERVEIYRGHDEIPDFYNQRRMFSDLKALVNYIERLEAINQKLSENLKRF